MSLPKKDITSKFYRLQPEYLGARKVKVSCFNVSTDLPEDILAAYLSDYGCVEVIPLYSKSGTPNGDYTFLLTLQSERFQRIPDTLAFCSQKNLVAVKGRQHHCWVCGQLGHLAKLCTKNKFKKQTNDLQTETTPTASTAPTVPNTGEGWIEVIKTGHKTSPTPGKTQDKPRQQNIPVTIKRRPEDEEGKWGKTKNQKEKSRYPVRVPRKGNPHKEGHA